MQRREFLAASAAAALGAAVSARGGAARVQPAAAKQWIELRTYHFASPEKLKAFEAFFARAAAPALGRAGVEPAGAFKLLAKDNPTLKLAADPSDLYVLLPHRSAESLLTMQGKLAADEAFCEAGAATLKAPKSDPAYLRFESNLLHAFDQWPQVQAPSKAPGRLVQLRIYESHNEERARKKIQMFNEGGEIEIFRRCGLEPVFFGESVAGSKLPNLTYMLAFDDEAAQKKAWDAFRADAEWKKLSADDTYKDSVSNITNLVLRPIPGSQV
jgi:hypothetical protein